MSLQRYLAILTAVNLIVSKQDFIATNIGKLLIFIVIQRVDKKIALFSLPLAQNGFFIK